MLPEEKYGVLIFLALIAAVYTFAFGIIVRAILSRFNIGKISQKPAQVWFRRIILSFAVIGIFCFAYGYFVEPYRLRVRNVEIKTAKFSGKTEKIRIVHISDLHSEAKVRLEEKLPQAIAEQKPDLIVFSGDSLNSPDGLPVFRKCLSEITKIAPTFVVRGNWDAWYWSNEDLFGGTGAIELDANAIELEIRGNKIRLTGIPVGKEGQISDVLSSIPKDDFSVFVYHYPDKIEEIAGQNVDLYCAGHTHGGQIALPLYGALVTLSKYGKRFEGGTYKIESTWLNVNRGIGMEGGHAPRVRFWSTPEITVIDVISK